MSLRALFLLLLAALLAASPWIGYGAGLANLDGRPERPVRRILTPTELEPLHLRLRKAGAMTVPRLSPFDYAIALVDRERLSQAGVGVAGLVADDFVAAHARWRNPFWARLSGMALTVWLTRNWSSDEVLTRASEVESRRGSS